MLVDIFSTICLNREKVCNISQKTKSSPLSYFAQKTSLNLTPD